MLDALTDPVLHRIAVLAKHDATSQLLLGILGSASRRSRAIVKSAIADHSVLVVRSAREATECLASFPAAGHLRLKKLRATGLRAVARALYGSSVSTLDLSRNALLSDLTAAVGLTALTALNLNSTSVGDISALSALSNLSILDMGLCYRVADISTLSGLTRLHKLDLSSVGEGVTSLSDVSALATLTNLTALSLADTAVADVAALSALVALRLLDLAGTGVDPLMAMASLTRQRPARAHVHTHTHACTHCTAQYGTVRHGTAWHAQHCTAPHRTAPQRIAVIQC